jgi:hypothetical protein
MGHLVSMGSRFEGEMAIRELPLEGIAHGGLRSVYEAWRAAEAARRNVSRRGDLPPELLPAMLGRISGLEEALDGSPHFRWRLMGTELVQEAGRALTGKTTAELHPDSYRTTTEAHYRSVLIRGEPSLHEVAITLPGRRRAYHRLVLPFADKVGRLRQVMVAVTGDLAPRCEPLPLRSGDVSVSARP